MGELLGLILANQDRDDQATGQRPQVHPVDADEPQDSRVVGNRGMLVELGLLVLVPLVGFADPMDDQDCGLRSELEPVAKLAVNQLLCQPLVGNATGEQRPATQFAASSNRSTVQRRSASWALSGRT